MSPRGWRARRWRDGGEAGGGGARGAAGRGGGGGGGGGGRAGGGGRGWRGRRRLAGTWWLWRVRRRRKSRSWSWLRQKRSAEAKLLNPRMHRMRPLTPRWSCSRPLFLKRLVRCETLQPSGGRLAPGGGAGAT